MSLFCRYGSLRSSLFAAMMFCACGDSDSETPVQSSPGAATPAPDAAVPDAAAPAPSPLFAISTRITTPDGAKMYVSLVEDLDAPELSPTNAIEFSGYVPIDSRDGDLFVLDKENKKLRRYEVGSLKPTQQIREVSSLGLGSYEVVPDFLTPSGTPDKLYLATDFEPTMLKVDLPRMALTGELPIALPPHPGFGPRSGVPITTAQGVLRVFYHQHSVDPRTSDDNDVVWIDPAADTVKSVVTERRCPALKNWTQDEAGNTYFSTWLYAGPMHRAGTLPPTCALRMRAGETVMDPDWVLDFAALTDGRDAAELNYVGNGKALLTVFHHERLTPADAAKTPYEIALTPNWRIWSLDLETRKATVIEDIPFSAGDTKFASVAGRYFIFVPGEKYAETLMYEIVDGGTRAVARAKGKGWIMRMIQIR